MIIYIIALFVLLYGSIQYDIKGRYDDNNKWLKLEWLLFVLIAGLRFHIGGDSYSYELNYNFMPTFSQFTKDVIEDSRYNVLWYVFCAFCKLFSGEFFVLQIIHALIVNTSFILFFRKFSKCYFTANLIYGVFFYFFFNTEVLRAALAVSCFLLGFGLLKHNKLIFYYLVTAICIGFHTEATVMLIFPIANHIGKLNMNLKGIAILVLGSLFVMTSMNLLPILSNFFNSYENIVYVLEEGHRYTEERTWNINGYIMLLFSFIHVLITLFFINKQEDMHTERGILIIYFFFAIQSIMFPIVFGRTLDFLKPIMIFCLAETLIGFYKSRKVILCFIILSVTVWSGMRQYLVEDGIGIRWDRYYPYSSILDPDDNPERKRFMDSINNY